MPKQTLKSFIESLDPNLTAAQMRAEATKAGFKFGKSTVSTLRSMLGIVERGRSAPSTTKSAAPARKQEAPSVEAELRRLIARVGTDRASEVLRQAVSREID